VGQSVTASVNCVDVISGGVASGVVTCGNQTFTPLPTPPASMQSSVSSPSTPVTISSTPGPQTITVTAKDGAGNVGTSAGVPVCVGYTITSVDRNGVAGFAAPVDNPGPGAPIVNQINSKQAIPLQLAVQNCNGTPITNLDLVGGTGVGTIKTVKLSVVNAPNGTCKYAIVDNSITVTAAGNSGWQNFLNGTYQFNWKSAAPVGSCLAFSADLGDSIPHTAYFQVIK
jgi:hypothetical protein